MTEPVRLAVLLSGSGRTLQNFLDRIADGTLAARVVAVVSSRPGVFGLERARDAGIPAVVVNRRAFDDVESFSRAVTAELQGVDTELVALAGFMCMYRIPDCYAGRVINIHPALLPSFGGKGFYGDRVHRAVIKHGCKVTGPTVHFADNEYDTGPIIVQRTVPVLEDDDAHTLADRVFEAELEAFPEAINLFAAGRLRVEGRRVVIAPEV